MKKLSCTLLILSLITAIIAVIFVCITYFLTVRKIMEVDTWYNAIFLWDEKVRASDIYYEIRWFKIARILLVVVQILLFVSFELGGNLIGRIVMPIFTLIEGAAIAGIALDMMSIVSVYDQKAYFHLETKQYYIVVLAALAVGGIVKLLLYIANEMYSPVYIAVTAMSLFVLTSRWLVTIGLLGGVIAIIMMIIGRIPTPGDIRADLIKRLYGEK